MPERLTTEKFIERAIAKHGNKYDYSKTVYVNSNTHVTIICPKHGAFKKLPLEHTVRGRGCPKCGRPFRHTKESFIEKAIARHGTRYDYTKVRYVNNRVPVTITCPKHGDFQQTPKMHLRGHGCPSCGGHTQYTQEVLIQRAQEVHGDTYDYSKTVFISYGKKVIITCKKHGDFTQSINVHLSGCGCPTCALEKSRLTQEEFITRGRKLFGDKYDYSLVEYKNNREKVKIICPVHGVFEQQPSCHLQGWGCVKCGNEGQLDTLENFIKKARKVHGNSYNYDNAKYIGSYKPITITCPKHGDFTQRASAHLEGEGCPDCKHSQGELKIAQYLDKTGVKYKREYSFEDCRHKYKLRFDFAVFNNDDTIRCLIEFQGAQHYRYISGVHKTKEDYKVSVKRDEIKREYCKANGITLLEVAYDQNLQEFFEEAGGLLWK